MLLTIGLSSACSSARSSSVPQRAEATVTTFGSEHEEVVRYLVLGDSTAVNVGGSEGEGIAVETARYVARDHGVQMLNLAVSGAQVTDVLHEQLPRLEAFRPDVVLLDVGANDVTHLSSARSLRNDLGTIIDLLVELNCDVKIIVTGTPDMSTPPRIPGLLQGIAGWRTEVLNEVFRDQVERRELTFAPIAEETGPLFETDPTLFSEDEFHPNDRGYQTWIEVINPALDRALQSQPSHCE